MKSPAVFLDRDGTLIEDAGFLRHAAQVDFYPQTFSALRRLGDYMLFIVTNQSGIAQGHIRAEEARAVNDYVVQRLSEEGTAIRTVYCCPHQRTDACGCMKPKPYFLRVAEREHEIDLARSFVVGDHPSDIELAHAVGARGIYVLTGHGLKHRAELKVPATVVADIDAAADVILETHATGISQSGSTCAS
jgi:histidinol-phosphate phosphatase family protein